MTQPTIILSPRKPAVSVNSGVLEVLVRVQAAMARAGGGQQYYGQTANDLFDNFDEELQLLQALCLRTIDLKLIPAPGLIIEPLGLVQHNSDGSSGACARWPNAICARNSRGQGPQTQYLSSALSGLIHTCRVRLKMQKSS